MHVSCCPVFVVVLIVFIRIELYCSSGFSYNHDMMTYETADNMCRHQNMTLLVTSQAALEIAVRTFLSGKYGSPEIWLGLRLPETSSTPTHYRWSNELPMTWSNWATSRYGYNQEPNDLDSDKCVVLTESGWHTRDCEDTYNFVCQPLGETRKVNYSEEDHTPTTDMSPMGQDYGCRDQGIIGPTLVSMPGGHFTRVKDEIPFGEALIELQLGSSAQCASYCTTVESCDVLVWNRSGNCHLFSSGTHFVPGSSLPSTSRVYKKNNITPIPGCVDQNSDTRG